MALAARDGESGLSRMKQDKRLADADLAELSRLLVRGIIGWIRNHEGVLRAALQHDDTRPDRWSTFKGLARANVADATPLLLRAMGRGARRPRRARSPSVFRSCWERWSTPSSTIPGRYRFTTRRWKSGWRLPVAVAAGGDDGRAGERPGASRAQAQEVSLHQAPGTGQIINRWLASLRPPPSGQAVRLSRPHRRCCWHRDPRANCRRSRHGMSGLQRLRPGRVQTHHPEDRSTRARKRPPGCRWPASRASPSGSYSAAWRGCSNLRGE